MMCSGVLALVGLEKAPRNRGTSPRDSIPSGDALVGVLYRKTLAARFRVLSGSVLSLLHQLTERFIETGAVDPSLGSVDSTLMHAQDKSGTNSNATKANCRAVATKCPAQRVSTPRRIGARVAAGSGFTAIACTDSRFAAPKALLGPQPSAYTQLTSKTPTSSMMTSFIACPKPLRSCSATAVTTEGSPRGMTKRAATETAMNVKSPCSHPSRSKKHAVRAAQTSHALPRSLHP